MTIALPPHQYFLDEAEGSHGERVFAGSPNMEDATPDDLVHLCWTVWNFVGIELDNLQYASKSIVLLSVLLVALDPSRCMYKVIALRLGFAILVSLYEAHVRATTTAIATAAPVTPAPGDANDNNAERTPPSEPDSIAGRVRRRHAEQRAQ